MDMKEKKLIPAAPIFPPLVAPSMPVGNIVVDPLGSYTGVPVEPEETPVQDADDL